MQHRTQKSGSGIPAEKEGDIMLRQLSKSSVFSDYREAFRKASGLPLILRSLDAYDQALDESAGGNPFCTLMAQTHAGCAACLDLQAKLTKAGLEAPATMSCFAGLSDSLVPLRTGGRTFGYLQTGQVLLHEPTADEFNRTSRELLRMGAEVDLGRLEEAYFQTKVLSKDQYAAFLTLLHTFANHLAMIGNQLLVEQKHSRSPAVDKAVRYIADNQAKAISLKDVARAVNMSSYYFCRMFKEETGMNFTEYLARLRVEKAKNMLMNPHQRVSEVAYEVGFQSLSQFNRSFARFAGCSPTAWRRNAA